MPKIAIDNRPSDYEYALMSQHVYQGEALSKGTRLSEDSNWKIHKVQSGDLNYFGAVYVNSETKQAVLAHRGSNSLKVWVENLQGIALNQVDTPQKRAVFAFIDKAIETANLNDCRLSFTGHSLGAFLAELSVYYCHRSKALKGINAVTFESPGIKESLNAIEANHPDGKIELNDLDIISYLSYPNIVNTCNHHIGTLYALQPEIEVNRASWWHTLSKKVVREDNQHLLQIHSMEDIRNQLAQNAKGSYMMDWPMGGQRDIFFNQVEYVGGQYQLPDEQLDDELDKCYAQFEQEYKGHYHPHAMATNHNSVPLRHFEDTAATWLKSFYSSLWLKQTLGENEDNKESDDIKALANTLKEGGISDAFIGALFTSMIETVGKKKMEVLSLSEEIKDNMTPHAFRQALTDFLVNHGGLALRALSELSGIKKAEQGGIDMLMVEKGADVSQFKGEMTQIALRSELPEGASDTDVANIQKIRENNLKLLQETKVVIKMRMFGEGSKPVGDFKVTQVADEVVIKERKGPGQNQAGLFGQKEAEGNPLKDAKSINAKVEEVKRDFGKK